MVMRFTESTNTALGILHSPNSGQETFTGWSHISVAFREMLLLQEIVEKKLHVFKMWFEWNEKIISKYADKSISDMLFIQPQETEMHLGKTWDL